MSLFITIDVKCDICGKIERQNIQARPGNIPNHLPLGWSRRWTSYHDDIHHGCEECMRFYRERLSANAELRQPFVKEAAARYVESCNEAQRMHPVPVDPLQEIAERMASKKARKERLEPLRATLTSILKRLGPFHKEISQGPGDARKPLQVSLNDLAKLSRILDQVREDLTGTIPILLRGIEEILLSSEGKGSCGGLVDIDLEAKYLFTMTCFCENREDLFYLQ